MVALRAASQGAPLFQRQVVFPRSNLTVVPPPQKQHGLDRRLTTSMASGSLAAGAALAMLSARLFARPRIFLCTLASAAVGGGFRIQLGDLLTQFASSSQTWTTGAELDAVSIVKGPGNEYSGVARRLGWLWLAGCYVCLQSPTALCLLRNRSAAGVGGRWRGRGCRSAKLNQSAQISRRRNGRRRRRLVTRGTAGEQQSKEKHRRRWQPAE